MSNAEIEIRTGAGGTKRVSVISKTKKHHLQGTLRNHATGTLCTPEEEVQRYEHCLQEMRMYACSACCGRPSISEHRYLIVYPKKMQMVTKQDKLTEIRKCIKRNKLMPS